MVRITWKQYFSAVIGLGIAILILQFYFIPKQNANICNDYFSITPINLFDNERGCLGAYKYNSRTNICYCENGEYYLDDAMIQEENRVRREIWQVKKDKNIEIQQVLIVDNLNKLNFSSMVSK